MVDVCFGGDGAKQPLPLIRHHITSNIGTQELRLEYDRIPELVDQTQDQRMWIYQYRNNPDQPWNSFYCFSEKEFLHADFEVMNFFTSQHPSSFQTFTVVIVKFLRRGSDIYGKVMLVNGDVKQNLGGKTKLIRSCRTENERVEALKEVFGITLTEEEKDGIKGRVTDLKG
jgi:arylamine N-acetyltransferase